MEQNKVYRLLGLAMKAGKLSFGMESVIDTIQKRKAKLVIVAQDAADRTKRNIKQVADENKVTFRIYGAIEEISKSIGKENKAVIAVKDNNFVEGILKIIDGGEAIG